MSTNIETMLDEREKRYGSFKNHSELSIALKNVLRREEKFHKMEPFKQEALDMICHKVARILNGDSDYDDNWVDVSGYSELVVRELKK